SHTLAWIFNPETNETIIYVNPTDGSLHIGDPGLLEIHLQGVVSVAESDFAYEPEAAAGAAALEGIDPSLLVVTASDKATTSESALERAGVWTMPADDGLRFHFERDRVSSIVSATLTDERDDGTLNMPVHVSSIELAHIHTTVLVGQNLTFNNQQAHRNV